ncbi:MAG TPA: phosphoglycerate kinase, partial [Acidobacteriota bacterium]|nr:phosphoglycerate kinase [Acidobacteriota bacterium]
MGKRGFTQTILETKTLSFAPIKGNRVLLRTEFNVPLKGTKITDDTRIQTSIPTIRALLDRGATNVVIVSHMGRPKKKDPALSMKPVGKRLSQLLGFTVPVVLGYDLKTVQKQFKRKMPRVILLENIRYHPGEEKNNMALGRSLSTLADIYVNDAFGTAHRCHASNGAVTSFLPSYIGLLMENELSHMQHVTETPSHPFVCVVGFAKISDKLSILTQLLKKADSVLIGGGVAFTFLAAQGHEVGT